MLAINQKCFNGALLITAVTCATAAAQTTPAPDHAAPTLNTPATTAWYSATAAPPAEPVADPGPRLAETRAAAESETDAAEPAASEPVATVPRTASAATTQTVPRPPAVASEWPATLQWLRHPYVALSIVLLVMGGGLLLVRRWLPAKVTAKVDAVKIIARLPLSARQSVVLLHVGRQVVMVGLSGDRMQALHVIAQPDEAALLLGSAAKTQQPAGDRFATRLTKEQDRFASADVPPAPPATVPAAELAVDTAVVPADEASLREARGRLQNVLSNLRELQSLG